MKRGGPVNSAPPKYISEVLRKGQKAQKGMVSIVEVYHDDWCDLLQGKGVCNCNPAIGNPETVQ